MSNGSLIFGIDGNSKKSITYNKNSINIAIDYLIISEGLYFNLYQKTQFKKVLELTRNFSKTYILPNRKLISKEILGVINEKYMKRDSAIIKKGAEIFGLLFLGGGTTISICTLLNIMDSGRKIPFSVFNIVYCQGHLAYGKKKMEHSFLIDF